MSWFDKVLVANRGEVAARVIRSLRDLDIASVAVFSDADAEAHYLEEADEALHIGPSQPAASYLDAESILRAARRSGATAIHPGYGFLSEDPKFARLVTAAGLEWIGPSPRWIEVMGNKTAARDFMAEQGLVVGSGSGVLEGDVDSIMDAAEAVGFPVIVKPVGGGGGIGMMVARSRGELMSAVERSSSIASRGFGRPEIYLERLLHRPRHVEFQIVGDRHGNVTHLFERDCSIQRRHQKLIEEAPAPEVDRSEVDRTAEEIVEVLGRVGYDSLGTVESLTSTDAGFVFLEMNTRLQVEHCVTEEVTGLDLVSLQIALAAGQKLGSLLPECPQMLGHAIEARVYAEDPWRFLPSPGRLDVFRPPAGVRVETGYREGDTVTPYYDPLLAKVIARGDSRDDSIRRLETALSGFEIAGVKHNIPALLAILRSSEFMEGRVHTSLAEVVVSRHQRRNS